MPSPHGLYVSLCMDCYIDMCQESRHQDVLTQRIKPAVCLAAMSGAPDNAHVVATDSLARGAANTRSLRQHPHESLRASARWSDQSSAKTKGTRAHTPNAPI